MHKLFAPSRSWDRAAFIILIVLGAAVSILTPGDIYRGWFALAAAITSWVFVAVYSQYSWRKTYAGRATMLAMVVTSIYTTNATLVLWYPNGGERGYPGWTDITELIYLALAVSALYKLRALTRQEPQDEKDPTKQ